MLQNYYTFLVAFIVLIIDKLSKYIAINYLPLEENITLIPHLLSLYRISNSGAAFGLLKGQIVFLITFTLIAIITVSIWILKLSKPMKKINILSLGFIMGGAAGNLTDRLVSGKVLDFIKLDFIEFPVFNLADIFINIGAAILIYNILLPLHKKS